MVRGFARSTTLVVLSNTPHPLDPSPAYAPKPVAVSVYGGKPAGPEDECRKMRPENGRSFELTEDYFAGRSAPFSRTSGVVRGPLESTDLSLLVHESSFPDRSATEDT